MFENKTALITASASGIGKVIAQEFSREGANVIISDINKEAGKSTADEINKEGGTAHYIYCNVFEEESVKNLVEESIKLFGQIDILVNNAGGVVEGTVVTHTLEEWKKMYDLNVTSGFLVSHYIIPKMEKIGGGVILNISSEVALKGFRGRAAYTSAKSAIVGLTRAMAVDHAKSGIRVNALCPGTVETPGIRALIEECGEQKRQEFIDRRLTNYLGSPNDIAYAAVFICSQKASYFNGSIISVDGGSTAR